MVQPAAPTRAATGNNPLLAPLPQSHGRALLQLCRGSIALRADRTSSLQCSAQSRPFGGAAAGSDGSRQQTPAAVASPAAAAAADTAPASALTLVPDAAPPVCEQEQHVASLLQLLSSAATYADKVSVLTALPAVNTFFTATREGRLLASELADLPPKEAYCLACLPAMHQQHILAVVPTGLVLSHAVSQLAASLARVEDFYDSIGGLLGYQQQCLRLIAQHEAEQAGQQAQHEVPQQAQHETAQQDHSGPAASFLHQQHHHFATASSSGSMSSMDDWATGAAAAAAAEAAAEGGPGRHTEFLVPSGLDLANPAQQQEAAAAVAAGIAALPGMAEVYPLGGAGDRLGLRCELTGEALPTAVLQYCGRPLLEGLVRDLQAREYLYWKLHGVQHTTPLAVMTSAAKGNHWRVQALFEREAWFGRGQSTVRLFQQPLVPMVAARDGRWLANKPLQVMMKPGGHGVIWKLMLDSGVFGWMEAQGREAAIVRQISNPMAGTDNTLLALAGAGFPSRRSFGFASCERVVGAAEGMNVLAQEAVQEGDQKRYSYRVTNVEYTEFERLGIPDASVDDESQFSVFPANTNVLYVGLQAVEQAVRASMAAGSTDAVLPGMILNLGKKVAYADPLAGGQQRTVAAGRLECTMQNLADSLYQSFESPLEREEDKAGLDTFLVYNQRRKVTSSAKRQLKPGSTRVHQTPDGSFYDLQRNAHDLLTQHCGMEVPEVGSVQDYLTSGPGFVFLAHPALGPLWQVVAQKIRGGSMAPRSELQLEVAEACLQDVHVQGSLLVQADAVLGHIEQLPATSPTSSTSSTSTSLLDVLLTPNSDGAYNLGSASHYNFHSLNGANGASSSSGGSGSSSGYSQPCSLDDQPPCEPGEPRLLFSQRCGRLRLHNVTVRNRGADWEHPDNVWWRHSLARHEACKVVLHGMSEFEARDVTLEGNLTFEVPDGHRMLVTAGPDGSLHTQLLPLSQPSWEWRYCWGPAKHIQLQLVEGGGSSSDGGSASDSSSTLRAG